MNCCAECFCDAQIQTMINTSNEIGNCDFCGEQSVHIISVDVQTDLSDFISDVWSLYQENCEGKPLYQALVDDWYIFNKKQDSAYDLAKAFINTGDNTVDKDLKWSIPSEYIEKYGVFSGHSWQEFSSVIKTENRFYNDFFRADQFASFLTYSISHYKRGTVFYRARICETSQGYDFQHMGAPPITKRKSGRVNPEGIRVLYLTSDVKTALNEVRASVFDFVSVGTFELTKNINVVNIPGLKNISPMLCSSGLESLAANIKIFGDIATEIAKPLRRNDSPLEYLPTQYITEFIKSKGYAGVEYTSAMGTGGINIAVFDESLKLRTLKTSIITII